MFALTHTFVAEKEEENCLGASTSPPQVRYGVGECFVTLDTETTEARLTAGELRYTLFSCCREMILPAVSAHLRRPFCTASEDIKKDLDAALLTLKEVRMRPPSYSAWKEQPRPVQN